MVEVIDTSGGASAVVALCDEISDVEAEGSSVEVQRGWQMDLESAEEAGGDSAAEASGKNSEPPVSLGNDWSWLDSTSISLTSSHSEGELDNDKDDGEDQDPTRPGLTPELLENGESKVGQNHGIKSSEDDGGEENSVFLVVGGDGDCSDPENGKSKETNSGVEVEKVTIVDDSEEVAEGSNESEASSSNEESMYPVAHDWLHVDGSRVEPKNEGEDCKEEADDCSKPGEVLLLPSLYEHIGEAAVDNVGKADE